MAFLLIGTMTATDTGGPELVEDRFTEVFADFSGAWSKVAEVRKAIHPVDGSSYDIYRCTVPYTHNASHFAAMDYTIGEFGEVDYVPALRVFNPAAWASAPATVDCSSYIDTPYAVSFPPIKMWSFVAAVDQKYKPLVAVSGYSSGVGKVVIFDTSDSNPEEWTMVQQFPGEYMGRLSPGGDWLVTFDSDDTYGEMIVRRTKDWAVLNTGIEARVFSGFDFSVSNTHVLIHRPGSPFADILDTQYWSLADNRIVKQLSVPNPGFSRFINNGKAVVNDDSFNNTGGTARVISVSPVTCVSTGAELAGFSMRGVSSWRASAGGGTISELTQVISHGVQRYTAYSVTYQPPE
jgi:hypothetical protein